ncbi:aromatic compound dioxygenase [Dendrothele bispora CBS 962.96]|uniref:Aromatic compound dioxygenase n=1 Tax=Dendrothele bispora (strain CBS 962.96) TaxID=1314807 RepID=A0A4S8L3Y4_DENBC|nr:aromatic compound dioxygenase [Dendrothele bispora CBS 962.96]
MVCRKLFHLLTLLPLLPFVLAHKEPKTEQEIETQRALQRAAYYCAPAVAEFTAARKRRFAQKVLGTNNVQSALPGYEDLFADGTFVDGSAQDADQKQLMECSPVRESHMQNNTCVLTPVVTEGPYYHKEGHPIRTNIAEYQIGLLTYLDIGVIDVNTCKPLPNVLVDIWQANATGHYAGHPDPLPELRDEKPQVGGKRSGLLSAFPRTKFEETWLRGAWPTDENGVVQFTTIFPGYYTGRATHIHTKVFTSWEPLPNGTFRSPSSSSSSPSSSSSSSSSSPSSRGLAHVGQFFFQDSLNLQIDKMWPYSTNPIKHTHGRTRNWRDSLNIFEDSHGPEGEYDPVFRMELLGGVITQGLGGFITMGINASADLDNWWKG